MPRQNKKIFKDFLVSVILVFNNDEDIITERLKEIDKILKRMRTNYEIILIDNGSDDNTLQLVNKLHSTIKNSRTISLSKKYDMEIALTAGLDNAIGDYVVLFNIYTDPPKIIEKLVEKLLTGYDIAIGKCKSSVKKISIFNTIIISLVSKISRHNFYYHHNNYLMAINRKAVNSVTKIRRKNRSFSYINYLIGFKKVYYDYKPITKFKNKITDDNFISLLLNITDMVISNSYTPIRILSSLGVFFSLLYLFYVFVIVLLAIFVDPKIAPQGWISLSTVTSVLFFLLFSLLALISEYIIRILNDTRNEPLYFISDEIDKSTILPKQKRLNIVKS